MQKYSIQQTNHHLVLWLLFLLAFGLRAWGLSDQLPHADEVAAAFHAVNYGDNGLWHVDVMWEHPPLRNVVIMLTGRIFGEYSAWGLRAGSVLLGSLTVVALGYLAWGLFRNRLIAYLAAFFLCADPLHIALSREAVQECMTPFFIVTGVLASVHGIRKDHVLWCYLSGALFGIASAFKWHGLFPWAVCAVAYGAAPWYLVEYAGEKKIGYRLFSTVVAYGAIPIALYTASFLPWLKRGHSLSDFIAFQYSLVKQHYLHTAPTEYIRRHLSKWAYQWFLWPTAWNDITFLNGKPHLNIAMGNILVWGLTLPSLYYASKHWVKEKRFEPGLLIVIFLASYLPLVLTTRGVYVFSAPAVIPFAFLLTAYTIGRLRESGGISSRTLAIYLACVIILTALMYPLSTFRALEYQYLKPIADLYSPH